MEVFRETKLRRTRRQAVTLARAIRAGRARAKAKPRPPQVDGETLRDLLEQAAAEARLVEVAANRRPWTATGLHIGVGEEVTWLAWGRAYLIKPLAVGVKPSLGLLGRVGDGRPQESARDSLTFTADRDGPLELAGRLPGELQEDGSIATDRVPYVASQGSDAVAVFRRDAASGGLTQLAGTAGCVSETGSGATCADGKALDGASAVAVSVDSKSVYVASNVSTAVACGVRKPDRSL